MKTARHIAVDLLTHIDESNAYSNEILDKALRSNQLNEKDVRLLTRLFYGVLENRILIDYYIRKLSKTRIKKIHKKILNALRIAIYQIVFLDSVPISAAVNESVKIANKTNKRSAGFVNGILRNFMRSYKNGLLPLPGKEEPAKCLSVKYSLPLWIVETLLKQYDLDTIEELAESNNQPPPISIRVNTLKTDRNELVRNLSDIGITTENSLHAKDGLIITGMENANPSANKYFKDGHYYIQDEASMMVAEYLSPQPGDTIFDLCAAPGGKTTHMAQMMSQSGKIRAFDLHEHRVSDIASNAKRLGIDIIEAECKNSTENDATLNCCADRVLLDVPCSGMGIFRRKPELRYRLEDNDLKALVAVQCKLLENAAKYVANKGVLVYSTCTVNYNENDKIIMDFLSRNKDYTLVDISKGRYGARYKPTIKSIEEAIHTYPFRDHTDGFFICVLQKNCC